jgi:hypothetical protein
MHGAEYQIEEITLTDSRPDATQIVVRLNAFAPDGWRVSAIDLANHPAWTSRRVVVLLERLPVADATGARRAVGVAGA